MIRWILDEKDCRDRELWFFFFFPSFSFSSGALGFSSIETSPLSFLFFSFFLSFFFFSLSSGS